MTAFNGAEESKRSLYLLGLSLRWTGCNVSVVEYADA
ncbi:hypothetical protein P303_04110 [Xylella fastidiosa MUL0034]|jgi:hypothetical protein|nr:hypothetical protein P303_04110 [Xylella fastidiosa MUL0034]